MRDLLLFLAAAAALAAGCSPEYGEAPFACATTPVCPEGYQCVSGICRRGAPLQDGRVLDGRPVHDLRAPDGQRQDLRPPTDARGLDQPVVKPDEGSGVLFQDSFTGSTQLSDDQTGAWVVSWDEYHQNGCDTTGGTAPDAWVLGKSWTDVTVSAKVRGNAVCGLGQAGVIARATGISGCAGNTYYFCVLAFGPVGADPQLVIGALSGQCVTSSVLGATKVSAGLMPATWYRLSFTVKGHGLSCSVSEGGLPAPVTVTAQDTSAKYISAGSVGFTTVGISASFDDLMVVAAP